MTNAALKGIKATILGIKESAWGTYVTATKDMGLVQSFTQADEQAAAEIHGLGQAKSAAVSSGKYTPKGSLELYMTNGRLMEWAIFGGTTTHADSTGDCTHTLVYADALPSVSIEESYNETSDVVHKWAGCVFSSSTVTAALDDYLKFRGDFIAKNIDVSAVSASAAVIPTTAPLRCYECSLDIASGTIDYVQNWEVTFNRNANVLHGLGSRVAAAGGSNIMTVDWKATVGFADTDEHARLLGATSGATAAATAGFAVDLKADNGTALGSGEHSCEIGLTNCQVSSINKTTDLGDFVMYDISGKGQLNACEYVDQILTASW